MSFSLARESARCGYTSGMVEETGKKKTQMSVWIIATVTAALLIMLAIGIAVL